MSVYRKLVVSAAGLLLAVAGFVLPGSSGTALADCSWDMPCFMSAGSQN